MKKVGRFFSESFRSNEDINKSKYGISSDLFQNSAEFNAGGFEKCCCCPTILERLISGPIFSAVMYAAVESS
jgi:hypothetical protein